MTISVVIPVYGCRRALSELYQRLTDTLRKITGEYEIILVDDCCPQGSWEDITKLCAKDHKVMGIRLSRNFGQHRAIRAGLDKARGDWIVIMDCDLQDRPEDIITLKVKADEGYDVVIKKRTNRKESFATLFFSRLFYKIYNYFTDGAYDSELCNYCIITRKVANEILRFGEQNTDVIFVIKWLGFTQTSVELENEERFEGRSSYSFKKKLKLAMDLISEYSNKPLVLSVKLGFIISGLAFAFIVYVIIRDLLFDGFDAGWASLIASVYLMGGVILSAIGIAGIYIGNVFNETKARPLYVIQEILNEND